MQLAKYVKFREEQFGGVLFETQSEKVYTLNQAAAAVVREIKAGTAPADIAGRLRGHFQAPEGTIDRDVQALFAELQEKAWFHERHHAVRRAAGAGAGPARRPPPHRARCARRFTWPGRSPTNATWPACTASRKAARARRSPMN